MATKTGNTPTPTVKRILEMVQKLAESQQKELESQLRFLLLVQKAQKLSESVQKNNITMKEIVEEVAKVRV